MVPADVKFKILMSESDKCIYKISSDYKIIWSKIKQDNETEMESGWGEVGGNGNIRS